MPGSGSWESEMILGGGSVVASELLQAVEPQLGLEHGARARMRRGTCSLAPSGVISAPTQPVQGGQEELSFPN